MALEKNIVVELYDLALTERKDDRIGKVVSAGALTEDNLIEIAVSQRTDLNAVTIKACFDILKDVAIDAIASGHSVCFGLGHFWLDVNGVFYGDHAKWDKNVNSLSVHTAPVTGLREAIKSVQVNVRGMAQTSLVINTVTDVASGEMNSILTPGGGVNLKGNKMKIVGEHPEVGIKLIRQDTEEQFPVPSNSILVNNPANISFILPQDLRGGDYKLSITTQFSTTAKLLNEPRTYVFDYILTV
jgi:hypothetical protein